ncbi:phage holin, LLH family [Paenibacillus kandeliae]|uniref:phage holin, LLH family n=1 Tax=Paenibacillus kandeliae TaxID=3231269 RepID=UPI003459E742
MQFNTFGEWIVFLLALVVAALIIWGAFELLDWARKNKKYALLAKAAEIGYAAGEMFGKTYLSSEDKDGSEKAQKAFEVASNLLKSWKVNISAEQIKYAVQLAWQKWEGSHKAAGSTAVINTKLEAVPEEMRAAAREVIHEVLEKG